MRVAQPSLAGLLRRGALWGGPLRSRGRREGSWPGLRWRAARRAAGNLLLDTEGRLVFLDFGLMCKVEPDIMEAFASGICHLLAGDWCAPSFLSLPFPAARPSSSRAPVLLRIALPIPDCRTTFNLAPS